MTLVTVLYLRPFNPLKCFKLLVTPFAWKYLEMSVMRRLVGRVGWCLFTRRSDLGKKQRFFFALLLPHIYWYSHAPLWDMQSNSTNLLWESLWMLLGSLRIGWDYYSSLQISWEMLSRSNLLLSYLNVWFLFIAHLFIFPPSSPTPVHTKALIDKLLCFSLLTQHLMLYL